MVAAFTGRLMVQVCWFGLRVGGRPLLSHSSNECGELSQWLYHVDSTMIIIVVRFIMRT